AASVYPLGAHGAACSARAPGGSCTCSDNSDIMTQADALIAEAREHGKCGPAPIEWPEDEAEPTTTHGPGWCDRCESYCYGDCEAV
ncbi:MAG TPA: hypothetical protein VM285_05680, partial [Polyangia bacterium]|nr:hypothetical protein [Polyangia bacterium]